jgi:hypothetical protein
MISKFELAVEEVSSGDLSVTMLIDGKSFGNACIDLVDLKSSALSSGAYDLQTCGCGTPQCAGFWEPIFVQHQGNIVKWEFDARYHPIVIENDESEFAMTRYAFDRNQYISVIQEMFTFLRTHPKRDTIGPYGFDPAIFDDEFPYPSEPELPFENGATIVVGYAEKYQQPWVWLESNQDVYPRQLLPTGAMWASFAYWSLMWDSQGYDLGQCAYRKEGAFQLSNEVTTSECNQEAENLAMEIQAYWGDIVRVAWDKVMDTLPRNFVRNALAAEAFSQGSN